MCTKLKKLVCFFNLKNDFKKMLKLLNQKTLEEKKNFTQEANANKANPYSNITDITKKNILK